MNPDANVRCAGYLIFDPCGRAVGVPRSSVCDRQVENHRSKRSRKHSGIMVKGTFPTALTFPEVGSFTLKKFQVIVLLMT